MTDELAIRAEGLGKHYTLGSSVDLSRSFREALMELPRAVRRGLPFGARSSAPSPEKEADVFWALRDFNLEVRRGEVLGIVGRNGAGKSTLLKILSRITAPSCGRAEIHGRVGSLLEVGTGFHPELSGRENVYLNGSILGMRHVEIAAKFDEIVEFAEVGRFIDTPVKRYSSGMRVRLGFAVAAFLEPEILFVDEVLAVGDDAFRKKCLGKMDDIAEDGRTVLFVSHNMSAVANLCTRAILIDEGRCVSSGETRSIIEEYLDRCGRDSRSTAPGVFDLRERRNDYADREIVIRRARILNRDYQPRESFFMGEKLVVRVELEGFSRYASAVIGVTIKDSQDQWLASLNTRMSCRGVKEPRSGREIATLEIEKLPLTPGTYHLAISTTNSREGGQKRFDYVDRAASFEVVEADVYGSGFKMSRGFGVFYLDGAWTIEGDTEPPNSTGDCDDEVDG